MEYYSTLKGNEVLIHATTEMNLECIIVSEVNQRKEYDSTDRKYLEQAKSREAK